MAIPEKIRNKKKPVKKTTAISIFKYIAKKSPQTMARQAAKDKRERNEYLRNLNDRTEERELDNSIASFKKKPIKKTTAISIFKCIAKDKRERNAYLRNLKDQTERELAKSIASLKKK